MLTRSWSKALNQPVFIDDHWNDAYIQTKDEQIEAMMANTASHDGWDESEDEDSDGRDDEAGDWTEDVWRSNSESESEDHDEDWLERLDHGLPQLSFAQRWVAGGSLVQNVWWTLAVVNIAPMLLYMSLPNYHEVMWPLQSPHFIGMLSKVLLNLLTLAIVATMLYTTSCSLEPLTLRSMMNWRQIDVEAPKKCRERLLHEGTAVVMSVSEMFASVINRDASSKYLNDVMWIHVANLDARVVQKLIVLIASSLVTLTCFHRVWAKTLVLLMAACCVLWNAMIEVKMQQQAAIEIFSLDPTFAFVNESIFIAIDGQNLEEGGSMAWAPYWGGVQQMPVKSCPKHYPQQLSTGGVLVTFDHVNEYVPCYLSAKETASAAIVDGEIQPSEAFQCFESIRLRVKDPKSVPGWSLHQHNQEEDSASIEKQEL